MTLTCLVSAATPANTFHVLGSGKGGPISFNGGADNVTGAQASVIDNGLIRITKAGAFPTTVTERQEPILVTGGGGLMSGLYTVAVRESNDSILLAQLASSVLPPTVQLVFTAQPVAADTITIGGILYTWKGVGAVTGIANAISIGANLAAALVNLIKALDTTGVVDTDYGAGTLPNPFFDGVSSNPVQATIEANVAIPALVIPTTTTAGVTISASMPSLKAGPIGLGDLSLRFPLTMGDRWGGRSRTRIKKIIALAGTNPTIKLFTPQCFTGTSPANAPVYGALDSTVAAANWALTVGNPIDFGDGIEMNFAGLLFVVGGTTPIVLITFDHI